jgi:hypothetical protein
VKKVSKKAKNKGKMFFSQPQNQSTNPAQKKNILQKQSPSKGKI